MIDSYVQYFHFICRCTLVYRMTLSFFRLFRKKNWATCRNLLGKKIISFKILLRLDSSLLTKKTTTIKTTTTEKTAKQKKSKINTVQKIREKKTMPTSRNCASIYAHVSRINDTNIDSE